MPGLVIFLATNRVITYKTSTRTGSSYCRTALDSMAEAHSGDWSSRHLSTSNVFDRSENPSKKGPFPYVFRSFSVEISLSDTATRIFSGVDVCGAKKVVRADDSVCTWLTLYNGSVNSCGCCRPSPEF